jgi:hypothetical protein
MGDPTKEQVLALIRLPDYDLGFWLLNSFVVEQARDLGIRPDRITEDFIEKVRAHVAALQADTADLAAVQVALHAIANGDPWRAGKIIREYLVGGASILKIKNQLAMQRDARRIGGEKSGRTRAAESMKPRILRRAAQLLEARTPRREWASTIAESLDVSDRHVRRVLKEAESKTKRTRT